MGLNHCGTCGLCVGAIKIEVVLGRVSHILSERAQELLNYVTVTKGCLKVHLGRIAPPVLAGTLYSGFNDRHATVSVIGTPSWFDGEGLQVGCDRVRSASGEFLS